MPGFFKILKSCNAALFVGDILCGRPTNRGSGALISTFFGLEDNSHWLETFTFAFTNIAAFDEALQNLHHDDVSVVFYYELIKSTIYMLNMAASVYHTTHQAPAEAIPRL